MIKRGVTQTQRMMQDGIIRRPLLRYAGSKFLAYRRAIADHMPPHGTYIEPFGGGGAVLLQKPAAPIEIYNDIDEQLVNFMRVMQDPETFAALKRKLTYTPYCKSEFERAYEPQKSAVDKAWATFVRSWMGISTDSVHANCGWKKTDTRQAWTSKINPSNNTITYAPAFAELVDALDVYARRLRTVEIWNVDALDLITRYRDHDRVLFYLDPPYIQSVLNTKFYTHNMNTEAEHRALADALNGAKAMVMLHGYRSALYDELFADWHRVDHHAHTMNNNPRVESLWLNPPAAAALQALESDDDSNQMSLI